MGREIMRVPLDFYWTLDKPWEGYVNPHYAQCRWCLGRGDTEAASRFDDFMRDIKMAGAESYLRPEDFAVEQFTVFDAQGRADDISRRRTIELEHEYPRWPWPDHDPVATLVAAAGLPADWPGDLEREVIRRLAGLEVPIVFSRQQTRPMANGHRYNYPHPNLIERGVADPGTRFHELTTGLGYERGVAIDGSGGWDVQVKVMKQVGLPTEMRKRSWGEQEIVPWAQCPHCVDGVPLDRVEAYEAWNRTDPPKGEGWQVWETVSEGSPITPVLPTAEALVDYLVEFGTEWDKRRGTRPTRAQAEALVKQGGAVSLMVAEGKVMDSYEMSEHLEKRRPS